MRAFLKWLASLCTRINVNLARVLYRRSRNKPQAEEASINENGLKTQNRRCHISSICWLYHYKSFLSANKRYCTKKKRPGLPKTARDWSIWPIPFSISIWSIPNWLIRDRFVQFGPKLASHGSFWYIRIQIDPSWAVLVSLSPNWPITGRFDQVRSKLTNHGPFWSVWAQIG